MQNINKIINKKYLTEEEIELVAHTLANITPNDEEIIFKLIHTLGDVGAIKYRPLVEKFLYFKRDPSVPVKALRTLCYCWDLTESYLDALKIYIKGAAWDDTDEARIFAISYAGEYLRNQHDTDLLSLLVELFYNLGNSNVILEHYSSRRDLLKYCSYTAIARAMGMSSDEFHQLSESEDLEENERLDLLDLTFIKKAENLINKNQS